MKNLQEYLDNKTDEEIEAIAEIFSKDEPTPEDCVFAINMVSEVYKIETGSTCDLDQITKYIDGLNITLAMYQNVRSANAVVIGTIMLTNDNYKFSLTERGTKHVEKMLRDMK